MLEMAAVSINGGHYLHRHPSQMDFSTTGSMNVQIKSAMSSPHHRHMWVITGPAGCGKTHIAQYLANELSIPYIEGDDVSNFQKPFSALLTDSIHSITHSLIRIKCLMVYP